MLNDVLLAGAVVKIAVEKDEADSDPVCEGFLLVELLSLFSGARFW